LHIIRSAAIASKGHPITLTIIGDGDYLTQLKEDIKKHKQDNLKITITGQVNNLTDYYSNANIFAYHSTLDSWPNVLMEAMGHGLPIVANKGQFSEVFCEKQKAFLCKSDDELSFAKTILNFINYEKNYNDYAQLSISRITELRSDKKNILMFKHWLDKTYTAA